MSLGQALEQHYAGMDTDQAQLKRMYDAQQTEIGQASLQAQKELAAKLQSKGIKAPLQEVECMTNVKTGEKLYFLKKG